MSVKMSGLPIKTGHIFIVVALVMAFASAMMIKNIAVNKVSSNEPKLETQEIAVAAVRIPTGATISIDDLKMVEWPSKFVHPDSIFPDINSAVGRVVKSDFIPGEPIFKEKLSGDKSSGGLPVLIPAGMRAITVGVSEIKGVAGFVKPGDHVDVLVTIDKPGQDRNESKITKTVLQNILVLASAQQMVDDDEATANVPKGVTEEPILDTDKKKKKKDKEKEKSDKEIEKEKKEKAKERKEKEKLAKSVSSITMAMTPEDAEKMALAEDSGDIRLVLRSEGDTSISDTAGADGMELMVKSFGGSWPFNPEAKVEPAPPLPSATPAVPAPPPGKTVELIEGGEKTSVSF